MRLTIILLGAALCGCGNGGNGDAGSEAGPESGAFDSPDDMTTCMTMLCVHGNQSPMCPSCSPSNGDICSPPANITCNYTNGCSGAELSASMCTCALPDAGTTDGGDGGSDAGTTWYWTCSVGI